MRDTSQLMAQDHSTSGEVDRILLSHEHQCELRGFVAIGCSLAPLDPQRIENNDVGVASSLVLVVHKFVGGLVVVLIAVAK